MTTSTSHTAPKKLKKNLTLFDVYAISTGAMFSSGFFLLPGIAAAATGPSVILAYLVAGILIMPAMFSLAELATAMPKSGATYYFLDRSLGPLAGTVGGLGTWLALVFKSAFALIGMGAYLVIFVDLPIKPVAAGLTVAFCALNIIGAKETSGLQRIFVSVLVGVLAFFVVQGLVELGFGPESNRQGDVTPVFPFGLDSFLSTIGLVFVSYAGLTKATSVAEEVENPDRNLPLGMFLSLATATLLYVVGVFVMVAVLEPGVLYDDLTPVATAGAVILDWLPGALGLILVVVAAVSAFASTGNAGILSASRYPLAMARDRLVPAPFAKLGRFGTPTLSVLITGGLMILIIFGLSEEGVAKLASAFQLLIFALSCLAVIIMRESQIPSYVPGFRSPLYPWMQIAGIAISVVLIVEMGDLAIRFTGGIVALGALWYAYYARTNVTREGAIYHLFARLGRFRYEGLDRELHAILEEKDIGTASDFDRLVARARIMHLDNPKPYAQIVARAAEQLATRTGLDADAIARRFLEGSQHSGTTVTHGAALPYALMGGLEREEMVIVHCAAGIDVEFADDASLRDAGGPAYAIFFLLSPKAEQSQHLRTQAALANRTDERSFLAEWRTASDEQEIKEVLLHHERYLTLHLLSDTSTEAFIDRRIRNLSLPAGTLVALVRRNGKIIVPNGGTTMREGDRVTIIGDPASIERVYELHRQGEREGVVE
jgi:amino acid transporter/mannitol/fructose-specific phosphotransferase system IIA component (Ntr-type)